MKESTAPRKIKTQVKTEKIPLTKKFRWPIIIPVLLVLAMLLSYYFYSQYQKTQALLTNPTASSNAQAKALVDEVGKLMVLPTNEQPTVATVSDVTKLADQPFFAKAQNGDKVLIYSNAKKAILYRPSINKIIEVAPVNLGSNPSQVATPTSSVAQQPLPTPSVTPQPKILRVAIYNGTKTAGLAQDAESKLTTKLNNIDVVKKADALNNYQNTLVIDVSGSNSQALSQFTNIVGGKTQASIPSGEVKPDADILIILGSDYTK